MKDYGKNSLKNKTNDRYHVYLLTLSKLFMLSDIKYKIKLMRLVICISLFFCIQTTYAQSDITLTFSQGHLGGVTALDISNNGNVVVSAGEDRLIKIWDVGQERLLRSIYAHDIGITDVSISKNSKYIVSSGLDHTIKIWSVDNGELLAKLTQLQETVQEVRFDNRKVIYINSIGDIFHWDWDSDNENSAYHWNKGMANGISRFIPMNNSNNVFIGNFKGEVQLWNTSSKKLKKSHQLHSDWVSGMVYIKSYKYLVSGSWDGSLAVWDVQNDSILQKINLKDASGIKDLCYSEENNMLIITSMGNHAYYYQISEGNLKQLSRFKRSGVSDTAFNANGEIGVISYLNGEIEMWDVKNIKLLSSWKPITSSAKRFNISSTSGDIAVASNLGEIKLWEFGSRSDLINWKAHTNEIVGLDYLANGNLVSCSTDSTIKIWNKNNHYTLLNSFHHEAAIHSAVMIGNNMLIADEHEDVFIVDLKNWSLEKIYSSYNKIMSICVKDDFSEVVLAFNNRKIGVLNLNNRQLSYIPVTDWTIKSIKYNHKGDRLLIGGKHQLNLLETENFTVLKTLDVASQVLDATFSIDDEYILVGEENGKLRSFKNDLSDEIYQYHQNHNNIEQVIDFPGKDVFITLSNNFSIHIWDLTSPNKYGGVYTNGESGWMVEHYSGLFDASESNMDDLYYVADREIIDISQLQNMYWEPGLGVKLFKGDALREVPLLNSISLFPQASLHKRGNKLVIDVIDRGGGIGKVGILVNGKEVMDDISDYKTTIKQLSFINGKQKERYLVPIDSIGYLFTSDHLNDITVIVENNEGTLNGRGLTIKHRDNSTTAIPNFYGIVIGVSDYRGTTLDLKYATKDAISISNTIQKSAGELFGENKVTIETFTTDAENEQYQPTKQNIKNSFDSLSTLMTPSDVLFIFMAGHGMSKKFKDGEEDFFFLTKDMITADIDDQEIREKYCISGKEWLDWMKKMPVTRQVFIMDACNAGQFAETILAVRNIDDESVRLRALERVRNRSGMYLLAGASADKLSYESSLYGQGLLTYAILDYFKTGNLRKGEFVDVQMLFGNAVDEVPRLAERFGASQQPEMRIPNGGDSFDIGRVTEIVKDQIRLNSNLPRIRYTQFEEETTWLDNLEISQKINKRLLAKSESQNNRNTPFIFSPYAQGDNVYQLKGKYSQVEEGVQLTVRLLENQQLKHEFEITDQDEQKLLDSVIFEIVSYFKSI